MSPQWQNAKWDRWCCLGVRPSTGKKAPARGTREAKFVTRIQEYRNNWTLQRENSTTIENKNKKIVNNNAMTGVTGGDSDESSALSSSSRSGRSISTVTSENDTLAVIKKKMGLNGGMTGKLSVTKATQGDQMVKGNTIGNNSGDNSRERMRDRDGSKTQASESSTETGEDTSLSHSAFSMVVESS